MALVTTTEMFKKAYEGHYAIGAFNINNMEIILAMTEAAGELKSPVILQVSAGARKYAKQAYLVALAQAAIEDSGIDLALHLDHGADFEICKACIDGGFSSDVLGYGTIFSTVLGHSGVVLFLVIAIMSQCTIYNTYLASGSRSFWVLSEDNLFPRFIRKVDRAGRSPYIGVLTIAISSLIFSQFDFTTIIEMNIIFILARYMFLGFIVMKLRNMYPVDERPADMFVIGGGKVGVVVYSALAFIIATFTLCLNPVQNFFFTAAFLASGVVAYIIFKKIYGGLTVENPVAYPQDPRTGLAVGDTRRIGLFALIIAGLFVLNLLINLLFLG